MAVGALHPERRVRLDTRPPFDRCDDSQWQLAQMTSMLQNRCPVPRTEHVTAVHYGVTNEYSVCHVRQDIKDPRPEQTNAGVFCFHEAWKVVVLVDDAQPILP